MEGVDFDGFGQEQVVAHHVSVIILKKCTSDLFLCDMFLNVSYSEFITF